MRSLYEFGSWSAVNKSKEKALDNSYRGNLHGGAINIYKSSKEHPYLSEGDPDLANIAHNVTDIDYGDSQYFKLFSMYALRYNQKKLSFWAPDKRVRSFGDTAVIIHDFESFISRISTCFFAKYGEKNWFFLDEVNYSGYEKTQKVKPLFSKKQGYEYQNELRIAIGLFEKNKYSMESKNARSIVMSTTPLLLNIGDIRDIAIKIPIRDFIKLRISKDIKLNFPLSCGNKLCLLDKTVFETRIVLKHFKSPVVKSSFTVW